MVGQIHKIVKLCIDVNFGIGAALFIHVRIYPVIFFRFVCRWTAFVRFEFLLRGDNVSGNTDKKN